MKNRVISFFFMVSFLMMLVACGEDAPAPTPKHTLSFEAAGGAGTMAPLSIPEGETNNLPVCAFTRDGHVFAGWATSAGGAVVYTNQASYIMGLADATLHAVWQVVAVTGVSLNTNSLTIIFGNEGQLAVTVAPANAADTNVTWTSDDTNVAAVTQDGKVIAVSVGNATITVTTSDGGKATTCAVTVLPKQIDLAAIPGIAPPVLGAVPSAAIAETAQYTGTVTWDGSWAWSARFGGGKVYTATIALAAKPGYTLAGVAADFFTVDGATSDSNGAASGVVTAVFPATATVAIGDAVLGGKVAYILVAGDPGYVAGEQRGLVAAVEDQCVDRIIWALEAYQTNLIGGMSELMGAGADNTDKIIAQNDPDSSGLVTYAAGLARAYTGGGYTDWFLPSLNELVRLYENKALIGGFTTMIYWNSTELWTGDVVRTISFLHGGLNDLPKFSENGLVRAVRYF